MVKWQEFKKTMSKNIKLKLIVHYTRLYKYLDTEYSEIVILIERIILWVN